MKLMSTGRSVPSVARAVTRVDQSRSAWLGIALTLILSGCGGPQGPKRVAITGNVTREGQPVDNGNIQFTPTGGGPMAMSNIADGVYKFTAENGPVAGTHKVQIVHFPPREEVPPGTPKKDADILPETRFEKPMPKEGWIKEVEVTEGDPGPIDFDLDE